MVCKYINKDGESITTFDSSALGGLPPRTISLDRSSLDEVLASQHTFNGGEEETLGIELNNTWVSKNITAPLEEFGKAGAGERMKDNCQLPVYYEWASKLYNPRANGAPLVESKVSPSQVCTSDYESISDYRGPTSGGTGEVIITW